MSEFIIAFCLGIIEGLTEFIPVSSTGHLILVEELLDFHGPKAKTFAVFIQLGAILAVVILYWHRFLGLLQLGSAEDGDAQSGFRGVSGILSLALVSLPALIAGLLFHDAIKQHLFGSETVAIALIVGGIAMLLVDGPGRKPRVHQLEEIGFGRAFVIGLFQCLSLWPGVSRSGSTIVGGMLLGLDRRVAAEFSFLAAVPIMCAAVGYDLLKSMQFLSVSDVPLFGFGFLVAFVSAVFAIRFFISLLQRVTLYPFAWYRIFLGIVVLLVAWM